MSLFFLVLYLASGEIKTGPFVATESLAVIRANAEMDSNSELIAVEVFDLNGKCVYSVGE